jgi:hypothetical protein
MAGDQRFHVQVGRHFTGKGDGGETHGPVAVLEGGAANGDLVFETAV